MTEEGSIDEDEGQRGSERADRAAHAQVVAGEMQLPKRYSLVTSESV